MRWWKLSALYLVATGIGLYTLAAEQGFGSAAHSVLPVAGVLFATIVSAALALDVARLRQAHMRKTRANDAAGVLARFK